MKKNRFAVLIVALLVSITAASLHPAIAQDNTPTNPASVGTTVRSMIELGSVYTNIYDIGITVLETVRTKVETDGSKMPAGYDLVIARVKFDFKGRYVSDNLPFDLGTDPLQWIALSGSDLTEYEHISVNVPDPRLAGRIKPGESKEGWLAFAIKQGDSKPIMVFDPDTGGATGRGRTLFFKLYKD